ncbi:hypothetical protein [Streptomyces sp. NPDC050504]
MRLRGALQGRADFVAERKNDAPSAYTSASGVGTAAPLSRTLREISGAS